MTKFYNTHDFKKKQIDFIQVELRKFLMEKNQRLEIKSLNRVTYDSIQTFLKCEKNWDKSGRIH